MVALDLAAYRQRACTGKTPLSARTARELAARIRGQDQGDDSTTAYPCPFCNGWHIGHALSVEGLEAVAVLLRETSGNTPVPPGSGSTKRSRRRAARKDAR